MRDWSQPEDSRASPHLDELLLEMPVRRRQHTIGATGVGIVRGLLEPLGWTVNETPEQIDYGVDADIEIFDPLPTGDTVATGLRFIVQSRATAEGDSRTIYLTRRQYNYLQSQDIPALLVRPDTRTREVRAIWLHARLPEASSPRGRLRFALSDDDLWKEDTPARISESVRAIRAIRTRTAFHPLQVRVRVVPPVGDARSATDRLVEALGRACQDVGHLVTVSEGDSAPHAAAIRLSPEYVVISIGEVAEATVVAGPTIPAVDEYDTFASDLLHCLGAMLCSIGYRELGIRLAVLAVPHTTHGHEGHCNAALVMSASDPYRFSDALQLCSAAGEVGHPLEAPLLLELMTTSARLPRAEAMKLQPILEQRRQGNESMVPVPEIMRVATARFLRAGLRREAISLWRRIDEIAPWAVADTYSNLRSRAGAEFLSWQFEDAARHYEKAVDLAPSRERIETQALLGDAYLKLGRLVEARSLLGRSDKPEWSFKHRATSYLVEVLGIESLAPGPNLELAASVDWIHLTSRDEVIAEVRRLAHRVGVDSLLWFNGAHQLSRLGQFRSAAEFGTIAAALGDLYDREALSMSILRWLKDAQSQPLKERELEAMRMMLTAVQVAAVKYGDSILPDLVKFGGYEEVVSFITKMIPVFQKEAKEGALEGKVNERGD